MLSMTSDYAADAGCPEPYLRAIAEAGFTHVHWCHHWNTDFLYDDAEIDQIARWLRDLGLGLTDLHASAGQEKSWGSGREYERLAGVALVRNRIEMTARLGADAIILHLPDVPADPAEKEAFRQRILRSLDALRPPAKRRGVRIALENGDFDAIETILDACEPEFVGLCYDCGHGNLCPDGLDRLERLKGRLIAVHLHDNDGQSDQHKLPFTGSVDWGRLMPIIAASAYDKWVSLETTIGNTGIADERDFLREALPAGSRLTEMLEARRAWDEPRGAGQ